MTLMIDPPGGWKYGFPKPFPSDWVFSEEELKDWLRENGYPHHEIFHNQHQYCRFFEVKDGKFKED